MEPITPEITYNPKIATRFRGFYPVVIDVETGGLNPATDALLEIAAITVNCDDSGLFTPAEQMHFHIEAFKGSKLNPDSLAVNQIIPDHPFRFAVAEHEALTKIFSLVRSILKKTTCNRAVLVGHNSWFDLAFLNAAIKRAGVKRNPFHAFTSFDTASLGALAYGQTVLPQLLKHAGINFNQKEYHSAIYDAQKTAELFCKIINRWPLGESIA